MARALFAPRAARPDDTEADEALQEMRAFGASDADIEAYEARQKARHERQAIEVHEDNVETVLVFEALSSQWRYAGMNGIRVGLDYSAIEPTARMLGVEIPPVRFQELRLMEQVARGEIARAASRQGSSTRGGGRGRRRRR